ncbi:MAG: TIGR04002 family protein [Eubacterium sp.]
MNSKAKNISLAGLMAAIIMVFTAFVKVPTGINGGYVHLGDSMIYLAGSIIAGPWAIIASAIGGALADILAGAPQWAIATAIIKAVNCVPFVLVAKYYKKKNGTPKIIHPLSIAMAVVSGLWTIGGYLVAEGIMYSFESALVSASFSVIQAVGSMIVFILCGFALDKANIHKFL